MELMKLEEMNKLKDDLDRIESLVENLKHINSKYDRTHHSSYNWVDKIKKLFPFTSIKFEKEDIDIEPGSIGNTKFSPSMMQIDEIGLEMTKIRSKVLNYLIAELDKLHTKITDKYKKEIALW